MVMMLYKPGKFQIHVLVHVSFTSRFYNEGDLYSRSIG